MSFRLSRRTFLRGAGASIALPFLDAMRPARASAATEQPRRFFLFYMPNGFPMERWLPIGASGGSLLDPLRRHEPSLARLTGLQNLAVGGIGATGTHACATGGFATASPPRRSEGDDVFNGVSVDQMIARASACATPLSSLITGTDPASTSSCQLDWSCLYTSHVSWVSPTTPGAKLTEPTKLFDTLFGDAAGGPGSAAALDRRRRRRSILDTIGDHSRALGARLGANDRRRVDEYLDGIRALECRTLHEAVAAPEGISSPAGGSGLVERTKLHLELSVLALRLDLTRVASFMYGFSGFGGPYDFLGVSEDHHAMIHGQRSPEIEAQLLRVAEFQVAQFGYLLDLLAEDHGDGPLLDSTLALFGNEFADANQHRVENLPVLLAGRAGGAVRTGLTLDLPGRPLGDLYLTLLRAWGLDAHRFGTDGRDPIPELLPG